MSIFNISHATALNTIRELDLEHLVERIPDDLLTFQNIINQFAKHLNLAKVRSWELMKRGYKIPNVKKIEHFKIYTNKSISNVHFDYCCHPKMNDEIVAFWDRFKSIITIHHKLCVNAYKKMQDNEPMVFIEWSSTKVSRYLLLSLIHI